MAPPCWISSRPRSLELCPQQPCERPGLVAAWEDRALERSFRDAELIRQQPLHDGAQVQRRPEIAVLIEAAPRETRPIRHYTSALDRTTDEVGRRRGAVIRASRAVFGYRAAELRCKHNRRVVPHRAQSGFQAAQRRIERCQPRRKLSFGATLVEMGVHPV